MGWISSSQESITGAISRSKMATSGCLKMTENQFNMGCFGTSSMYGSQKLMTGVILRSQIESWNDNTTVFHTISEKSWGTTRVPCSSWKMQISTTKSGIIDISVIHTAVGDPMTTLAPSAHRIMRDTGHPRHISLVHPVWSVGPVREPTSIQMQESPSTLRLVLGPATGSPTFRCERQWMYITGCSLSIHRTG